MITQWKLKVAICRCYSRNLATSLAVFALFVSSILGDSLAWALEPDLVSSPSPLDASWTEISVSHSRVAFWTRGVNPPPEEILERILPRLESLEAHPVAGAWLPSRWSVLFDSSWTGAAGYWSPDLRAPDDSPAVLLKPQSAVLDPLGGFSLLVHEAIHLGHARARPWEAHWVREGVALLGEYLVTRNFNPVMALGFQVPETSLVAAVDPSVSDHEVGGLRGPQYGHVLQYFFYLYRVCGGDRFYKAAFEGMASVSPSLQGGEFLDSVLKKLVGEAGVATDPDVCRDFRTSFVAFERARLKQDRLRPSAHVIASGFVAPVRPAPPARGELPPWSATQYRLSQSGGKCEAGDESWKDRCLRIRME